MVVRFGSCESSLRAKDVHTPMPKFWATVCLIASMASGKALLIFD